MSSYALAQEAIHAANRAYACYEAATLAFRAALIRRDVAAQETERERAVSAVGEYFDQLMIANRE